jgi:transcriptional regulator with XRE-family HTH domain
MVDLAAIRRSVGLTQIELAARLGVGQAAVSKIERHSDILLSTLSSYLAALGVDANVVVDVGGETMTFDLTTPGEHDDHPG